MNRTVRSQPLTESAVPPTSAEHLTVIRGQLARITLLLIVLTAAVVWRLVIDR